MPVHVSGSPLFGDTVESGILCSHQFHDAVMSKIQYLIIISARYAGMQRAQLTVITRHYTYYTCIIYKPCQ